MAISLSEQLESDIKEYLHKTFGTYFSSLDERFAADIKEDVINTSDFHHGSYNDDDISIAFQRVTLGRMGHPDWQIYHLCTDTEANTMKQNVKVNTPIHIRPASHEEAGLFYSQMKETEDAALGTVGHVRMDFGSSGKGFYHTWWPHNDDQFNTEEFKGELQEVVDALRADGPLKDLASMRSYCYPEAMTMLLGGEVGTIYPSATERVEEPPKPFVLPPIHSDMRRVYAYLVKHRNIDRSVVAHFAREKLLYEDAKYHNAVFVGTDEESIPRHAHKRSTNSYGKAFRLNVEGCDPRYSFHHMGTDESLFVFEAPIDMLSYITLHPQDWQRHSYVACCGTSIQPVVKMLERKPQIHTVLLCLDNDEAGHLATQRMKAQLEANYTVKRLVPENKDWNDDLTTVREQKCESCK